MGFTSSLVGTSKRSKWVRFEQAEKDVQLICVKLLSLNVQIYISKIIINSWNLVFKFIIVMS